MPQSRVKTQKGGHYEVQVSLPRSVVLDLVLARRRVQGIMDAGTLICGDEYLALEMINSVLSGLIARVNQEIQDGGFTWNIAQEFGPEA